ncbi:hypothetical protein NE237_007465 [Protea cynaroides]|uniref:Trichome birefringence-like C-terminal domain-containing protein n=1 Tax=Protea cynaroides TaxID=273540 RepID=A0A9Q0KPH8_9MAGN|nr:hypothetical protein NE237_007465 [Protea cynaroides]
MVCSSSLMEDRGASKSRGIMSYRTKYCVQFSRRRDYGLSLMLNHNNLLVDIVNESIGRVLKLDSIINGDSWKNVDVLIFNNWHWWFYKGYLQPLGLSFQPVLHRSFVGVLGQPILPDQMAVGITTQALGRRGSWKATGLADDFLWPFRELGVAHSTGTQNLFIRDFQ